jgi:hypothetical protein
MCRGWGVTVRRMRWVNTSESVMARPAKRACESGLNGLGYLTDTVTAQGTV